MKSSANYSFSKVPTPQLPRSIFNRSTPIKTTFDTGYLVPVFVDEILPGDTMSVRATFFARLAPLVFPIMDNVYLDTFWFFIPNRLVWSNWERFNGAQDDPTDTTDYLIPILDLEGDDPPAQFDERSLFDYMGLPVNVDLAWGGATDQFLEVNALPLRAYQLVWNEWFRDQNLQDHISVITSDGPDPIEGYNLMRRGKRHDYFTSVLPWPQKGDSVMLPIGETAPVYGDGKVLGLTDSTGDYGLRAVSTTGYLTGATGVYGDAVGSLDAAGSVANARGVGVVQSGSSGLIADLSAATAATVNQLRQAFAFQQILEADARGGTRYTEMILAHFKVVNPDFRLQRPEYLGGSSQRINIQEVPQTSPSPASNPTLRNVQGGLAAYARGGASAGFTKSFTEHGHVIGLVNVRSDMTYQGGVRRMWSRRTRFDYYLPALANLGEQEVLNKELIYDPTGTGEQAPNAVFGYQERWAEMRYFPGQVTGQFRSIATDSLDAWHLAYDFASVPPLNENWIVDDPPVDRVVSVPGTVENPQDQVLMDGMISINHARIMPMFSVPGLRRL